MERASESHPGSRGTTRPDPALAKQESAVDLEMEDRYATLVTLAELAEKKAEFALEAAKAKKKTLPEFKMFIRSKELESEIYKARSDELAKQATWELSKVRLEKAKRLTDRANLPEVQKRILALILKAFPIQEGIKVKLDQLIKGGRRDDSLQMSLRNLTSVTSAGGSGGGGTCGGTIRRLEEFNPRGRRPPAFTNRIAGIPREGPDPTRRSAH